MVKGWVDANLILDNAKGLDDELKPFKYLMEEVPNRYDTTHKVYEKNGYIILKVHSGNSIGFIIHNTKKEWEGGHTHLKSFDMAKTIISNVIQRKKPKTNNVYLMKSHIRISDNEQYSDYIEQLILIKRSKTKNSYTNKVK